MKRLLLAAGIILTLIFTSTDAYSGDNLIFTGGFNRNTFIGEGQAGNRFDYGNGYSFEVGLKENNFCWIFYGLSASTHNNHVKQSVAKAEFFTPYYTEFRFYTFYGLLFYFLGFDVNKMKFENTEGSDIQYFWSLGLGAHLALGQFFLQPKFKPYLVTSNTLDQSWGIQMQVNIGFSLGDDN